MQNGGEVWNALAEIGLQLQILAGAHTGQGPFRVHAPPLPVYSPLTCVELTNEFLKAKARADRSDSYLRAIHYTLRSFTRRFGAKDVSQLHAVEIEKWLYDLKLEPVTLRRYLGDVRTMLNFGVRRNYLSKNPAAGVELPEIASRPVIIHTPEQARATLNFSRAYDLSICRALAIRYFAGLRSIEVERIDERAILEKHIEVSAARAKTRRRRLVVIQPNLRRWLDLGGELPAPPQNGRRMLEFQRALVSSGVAWPHNVTRHSFVSYHLAKFQSAAKTALEAGHTEQMLFAHYREIVTPEAAENFFGIVPN
jgi:site-specific recombinase XerC